MQNIYNAALMQHNAHPDYKYLMDTPTHVHDGVNPSCGDAIELRLRMNGDVIEEVAFTGSGFAVSQASTDIMADLVTDLTRDEALRLADIFLRMITGDATESELDDLGEAAQLQSISLMPARVKCAELGWRTLQATLAG